MPSPTHWLNWPAHPALLYEREDDARAGRLAQSAQLPRHEQAASGAPSWT